MDEIWVPQSFEPYMEKVGQALHHPSLEGSANYRRWLTRTEPLLFALVYFPHLLKSEGTKGLVSLCQFHIDIAFDAANWVKKQFEPSEKREVWIGPREMGKSMWLFLILPIWAAAHEHRRYIVAFADSSDQAEGHLGNLTDQLRTNVLLRNDYPLLCDSVVDNIKKYTSKSDITIEARGIDSSTLGKRAGSVRPDLLLFDDVEPKGTKYTIELKKQRLANIIESCFAMNVNAVVQISGTTTMYGSIIHECVISATGGETADWITDQNIKVNYYPAIVDTPDGEQSLWPQRWSYEWLAKQRKSESFALNYMNNPTMMDDGAWWSKADFLFNPPFSTARMVMAIDPAVTSGKKSDYTGIVVVSTNNEKDRAVIEFAQGLKLPPRKIREYVHQILNDNPLILEVIVERNQGGDTWSEILLPLPRNIKLLTPHETNPKPARIKQLLDCFQREWVYLRREMPGLQDQCLHYPLANDDIVDAAARGVHHFLADNLGKVS